MSSDGPARPLILIVDDDDLGRSLLEVILKRQGYQVALAYDGMRALDLVRRARPAALICDVHMNGLDGFAVTRALRADSTTANLPIILLTSHEGAADFVEAQAAGASALLEKSRHWEPLLEQLAALLGDASA